MQDERFDQSVDGGTAFRHTTMLCMPVTHGARKPSKVLGVFQLVNKFDGLKFTRNDENFVEAFAIFCGMGINNVRMYEKTVVAMAKQQGGWIETHVDASHFSPFFNHLRMGNKCISYLSLASTVAMHLR